MTAPATRRKRWTGVWPLPRCPRCLASEFEILGRNECKCLTCGSGYDRTRGLTKIRKPFFVGFWPSVGLPRNWRVPHEPSDIRVPRGMCRQCRITLSGQRRLYCSDECKLLFKSKYHWEYFKELIKRRDGDRCTICGSNGNLAVDHIIPVSQGGARLDPANCRTLCRDCHNDAFVSQFLQHDQRYRDELKTMHDAFVYLSVLDSRLRDRFAKRPRILAPTMERWNRWGDCPECPRHYLRIAELGRLDGSVSKWRRHVIDVHIGPLPRDLICGRCGHQWKARHLRLPWRCPRCRTWWWSVL